MTLVRSIFEHCCQIWSPQKSTSISIFDKLQKRAVKWILKEKNESYPEVVFLSKLKELDILPMKSKFLFTDLVLFLRIFKNDVKIELPYYITRIEPQDVVNIIRYSKPMADGPDNLKYMCEICPKIKNFQDSYFVRTVNNWNNLPFDLRNNNNLKNLRLILRNICG